MKKSFNLYLVRHGESHNNSVPQSQRVNDPPLTDLGHTQATLLADRISKQFSLDGNRTNQSSPHLDKLYTSAFLRTMQTIHPTTSLTGRHPEIWTDLFEVGGCFDGYLEGQTVGRSGMTRDEIATQFPGYKIPADIDDTGWWKSKPREKPEEAASRANSVAKILLDNFHGTDASVLCIIHGDLIRLLMDILVTEQPELTTAVVHNTSMTHLRFSHANTEHDYAPEVLLFNDTSHLRTEHLSL